MFLYGYGAIFNFLAILGTVVVKGMEEIYYLILILQVMITNVFPVIRWGLHFQIWCTMNDISNVAVDSFVHSKNTSSRLTRQSTGMSKKINYLLILDMTSHMKYV